MRRIARSTRHFLDVLDDLNRIGVEFVSFREQIEPAVRWAGIVVIIGAIAELERNLIIERVSRRHAARPSLKASTSAVIRCNSTTPPSTATARMAKPGQIAKPIASQRHRTTRAPRACPNAGAMPHD